MKDLVPLEEVEQTNFVKWLEDNNLKFTAIPNSTYTKYINQKIKNKRTGLRAGFPDIVVLVPPILSRDGEGYFLCIEMKRLKGSVTSKEQIEWYSEINSLNSGNVQAYICKGAEEAKKVVSNCLKNPVNNIF